MVKSTETEVNRSEERIGQALEAADAFLKEQGLSGRDAIHVRLLVEETLGMVRAMTGDFRGLFWLERDGDTYQIRLSAQTEMDKWKKKDLISVSTSGENAAAKGFMGKIGDIIENGLLHYSDVMRLQQKYDSGYLDYGMLGVDVQNSMHYVWSLHQYQGALGDNRQTQQQAEEAWDELERSIVASLADDVVVGVKSGSVELTIRIAVGA